MLMPLAVSGEDCSESLPVGMQASVARRLQLRKKHTARLDKKLEDITWTIDSDKLQLARAQDPEIPQARHAGDYFCSCSLGWDGGESA